MENLSKLTIYGFVTLSLVIVAVTVAKISFALTLLTLANGLWRWINWTVWFLVIVMVVITIPVAILPWVQCIPLEKSYIDFIPGKCIDKNHTVRLGMFLAGTSSQTYTSTNADPLGQSQAFLAFSTLFWQLCPGRFYGNCRCAPSRRLVLGWR